MNQVGKRKTDNLETVIDSWGEGAPEWVRELALTCNRISQKAVADQIGLSSSVVCQVLGNKYRGDVATFEQRVRGLLMHETVACPVAGNIKRDVCIQNQELARGDRFATSSMRGWFNRTCPTCPNATKGGKHVAK